MLSFVRSRNIFSELRTRGGPLEPPLHFVMVWFATKLPIGFETAARLPAALAGTGEVAALMLVARRVARRRDVAIIAGVFLAVAPFAVRYSQENRYYTTFSALHLLTWWLLLRALEHRRIRDFGWWGAGAALLMLAHPFAPLVLVIQVTVAVVVVRRSEPGLRGQSHARIRFAAALAAVIAGPWFLWGAFTWIPRMADGRSFALNAGPRPPVEINLDLFTRIAEWLLGNSGRADLLVLMLLLLMGAAILLARAEPRRVGIAVMAYGLGVLLVLIPMSNVLKTYLAMRRIEVLLPPALLLGALGVGAVAARWERPIDRRRVGFLLTGVVVLLSVVGTVTYYTTQKTGYRALAQVVDRAPPSGLVVIGPVDERWPDSIRQYLKWKGVDRAVRFIVFGRRLPQLPFPRGGVVWLTASPPLGPRFSSRPLNRLHAMQVIAGDQSAPGSILPWFVSRSNPRSDQEFRAELDQVRHLPTLLPPPPSSSLPWWLLIGR